MDPLDQLKDIHLPQEIPNYPIAIGWWILALSILLFVIFAVIKIRQIIIERKAKKLALKKLNNVNDATAAIKVLKWSLLQYFSREKVAHLSGDSLHEFLIANLPVKQHETFQQLSANGFNTVYQHSFDENSTESSDIISAAKLWIKHALPPKKELPIKKHCTSIDQKSTKKLITNTPVDSRSDSLLMTKLTTKNEHKNDTSATTEVEKSS